jgi:hypothetical protein
MRFPSLYWFARTTARRAGSFAVVVRNMLALLLRVSRPYYYLVTLWLYLLPTGAHFELLGTSAFWLGVAYCTLPLNALCYLMNDLADVVVDADNARKGGNMLGAAKEGATRLREAIPVTAAIQLPFLLAFAALCGARTWPWFGGGRGTGDTREQISRSRAAQRRRHLWQQRQHIEAARPHTRPNVPS